MEANCIIRMSDPSYVIGDSEQRHSKHLEAACSYASQCINRILPSLKMPIT